MKRLGNTPITFLLVSIVAIGLAGVPAAAHTPDPDGDARCSKRICADAEWPGDGVPFLKAEGHHYLDLNVYYDLTENGEDSELLEEIAYGYGKLRVDDELQDTCKFFLTDLSSHSGATADGLVPEIGTLVAGPEVSNNPGPECHTTYTFTNDADWCQTATAETILYAKDGREINSEYDWEAAPRC